QRGLHGNLGRLQVANLTDQDDIRVLPQDRPQRGCKGQLNISIDRALADAIDFVLDGVFRRDDFVLNGVQLAEGRVERCRLARTSRPGDQDDAVGLVNQLAEAGQHGRLQTDLFQVEVDHGAVEHADDHALAEHGRQYTHTEIDWVAANHQFDTAVLW